MPATKKSPKKGAWAPFPFEASAFLLDDAALKKRWGALHKGDLEPWPKDAALREAWRAFHAGAYQAAHEAGLALGGAGLSLANKAQALYATYLEKSEAAKQRHFLAVAERAERHQAEAPEHPNAWYWQAYALGRYGQSISVSEALAQGLGFKIKAALERTLALAPQHADAHVALGTFHAEVIDKVGRLLAIGQGADVRSGLALLDAALKLNPKSAITLMERANGLVMLEGEARMPEAEALYAQAAKLKPQDATECLDIELAKSELEDE